MPESEKSLAPSAATVDTGLDVAAAVSSLVPWLGGPISNVLSGFVRDRKIGRVQGAVAALAEEMRTFRSDASEEYVRTGEFEELLEQTLRRVADERNDEKRDLYRAFLRGVIKSPEGSYDERLRFLQDLEALQPDHVRILRAMLQPPDPNPSFAGSPGQTLARRIPEVPKGRLAELACELTDRLLVDLSSFQTMMTGHGAEDLAGRITAYGRRFLGFLTQ